MFKLFDMFIYCCWRILLKTIIYTSPIFIIRYYLRAKPYYVSASIIFVLYTIILYYKFRPWIRRSIQSRKETKREHVTTKQKGEYLSSGDINEVDNLTGAEFEEFLVKKFKQSGNKAYKTKASNDYGADIVLKKSRKTVIIQAKRYSSSIGVKAVQETVGALSYYKASHGIVITNNYFTKNAIKLARANKIDLWDRDQLIKRLSTNDFDVDLTKKKTSIKYEMSCPYCHSKLVVRSGKYGRFYGCSKYPKCSFTETI